MDPASLDQDDFTRYFHPRESESDLHVLEIQLDERAGSIRVRDPRLFHVGGRGFCRRLVEAAARRPGVRKAEIDPESASCRGSAPAALQAAGEVRRRGPRISPGALFLTALQAD